MSLPDIIEIVSLPGPVHASITVPGSKSVTNRALILAALARGEVRLQGALWSEDTQIMVECLQELGFMVNVAPDPAEGSNRNITVYGKGGIVPRGGTEERPLELFVGNAGTAARFVAAMVCLGDGVYRLHGVPRMHERPQGALFKALRELGYRVDPESGQDRLPARIYGSALPPGGAARSCTVSIEESSQFASALLLCAKPGGWRVQVSGENAEESPYVSMTSKLIAAFPSEGGRFRIEPDASSGSYFLAAGTLEPGELSGAGSIQNSVTVANWPSGSDWQMDSNFPIHLARLMLHQAAGSGSENIAEGEHWGKEYHGKRQREYGQYLERFFSEHGLPRISRKTDLGDSIMMAIVLAPLAQLPVEFIELGRLRLQECERVVALREQLTRCGARISEHDDSLTVQPSELHGAEIETYDDHRMAMCFAILGLKVAGIKIKNPACVKKTFPDFFQKLSAPPPGGLGARILDVRSGQALAAEDLFAG